MVAADGCTHRRRPRAYKGTWRANRDEEFVPGSGARVCIRAGDTGRRVWETRDVRNYVGSLPSIMGDASVPTAAAVSRRENAKGPGRKKPRLELTSGPVKQKGSRRELV